MKCSTLPAAVVRASCIAVVTEHCVDVMQLHSDHSNCCSHNALVVCVAAAVSGMRPCTRLLHGIYCSHDGCVRRFIFALACRHVTYFVLVVTDS
jgi:hypothetical protein